MTTSTSSYTTDMDPLQAAIPPMTLMLRNYVNAHRASIDFPLLGILPLYLQMIVTKTNSDASVAEGMGTLSSLWLSSLSL